MNTPAPQTFALHIEPRNSSPHGQGDSRRNGVVHAPATPANLPIFSGRKQLEERQIVYYADGHRYLTRWFSEHLYKYYVANILRMGGQINSVYDRFATYDIYLNSDNTISRNLIDLG